MVDSNFYKLEGESVIEIAKVVRYLKLRGVSIVWKKKDVLNEIVTTNYALSPFKFIPSIPKTFVLYTNQTVSELVIQIKELLGIIRDNDMYDVKMKDNIDVMKIKEISENGED